jgi:hypothetical protein
MLGGYCQYHRRLNLAVRQEIIGGLLMLGSQRSIKVTVHLGKDGNVEGWDYGENSLGFYVALDGEGRDIHFIPIDRISSVSWHHEAKRARFSDDIGTDLDGLHKWAREFEKRLWRPLELVDYNYIRRISSHLRGLRSLFHSRDTRVGLYEITAIYDAHIALFNQLQNSGLEEVFEEEDKVLRSRIIRHVLPAAEADVVNTRELESVLATVKEAPEHHNRSQLLSAVTPDTIEEYIYASGAEDGGKLGESNTLPRRLKIVSAAGKFALGGLFASANLGLGAFAGVVSALPTLTLGTVSAAVGVAASTYTGLNTSLDALKDMAAAIERPKKD